MTALLNGKRVLALLLLLCLALISAAEESRLLRRTSVRGGRQYLPRELGVGGGNGGSGKHNKSKSNKSARSPKSGSKPDSEDEELPVASKEDDDDKKDKSGGGSNKSPKGPPGGDMGGDSEDMSNGGKTTKANSGKNADKGKGKGKGKEHFRHENVEKFRRDLPDFAISYSIPSTRSSEIPGDGDYNELSVVSEEFLDRSFKSVFEDMAVGHFGTAAYAMINDDAPFTVDFRVSLDFGVPGEVPTTQFLLERLGEAFEREASAQQYLFDLNAMSSTNPFSASTSFTLIAKTNSDQGLAAGGLNGRPGSNRPPVVSNTSRGDKRLTTMHVIIIVLSIVGGLTLLAISYLWFRGRNDRKFSPYSQDPSNGKLGISSRSEIDDDDTERSGYSDPYGADDETVQYLKSLRERYNDETVPRGYRDVVDDDSEIKNEKDGIVFLRVDGQVNCDESRQTQREDEQADAIDLLQLEMNSTNVEDDLGSF